MNRHKVLLAGATGYLGGFITKELIQSGFETIIIVRDKNRAKFDTENITVIEAEVTKPQTLEGIFENIDTVISTVGITRQKDGLTYMDVDYKANVNLIEAAKAAGVKKFIYVSVLNGDKIRHLKIGEAKEKLADYLKASGLNYCLVRPNGFFSDMRDFLNMAKGGKVYLFGDGSKKLNPIHGEDLAKVCVDAISGNEKEINVGGPDVLSQNEIAGYALRAFNKPVEIVHLPDWLRRLVIWGARTFTSPKTYGPIEFFMTTMVLEMVAPTYGKHKLEDFFKKEAVNIESNMRK